MSYQIAKDVETLKWLDKHVRLVDDVILHTYADYSRFSHGELLNICSIEIEVAVKSAARGDSKPYPSCTREQLDAELDALALAT
jgi:hypothetical protein